MKKLFSTLVLSAAALAVSGTTAAQAAPEIPCSTARLIVPWKAGGGTHVIFSIFENTIQGLDVTPKIKVITIPGQGGNGDNDFKWDLLPVGIYDGSKLFSGTLVNFIDNEEGRLFRPFQIIQYD